MELEKIAEYARSDDGDPYWLILPGDEGLFEIDANSRKITTPTEFSRNGVGVEGDELAEIIYFSIDRYFDTTDLFEKEIFIQYELPDGDTGLVPVLNKTIKFKKDKVVFGWPIDDNITKVAGNVKYSVRFYERGVNGEGKQYLKYSFNTLTSTIKINSTLNFDIDSEDDITNIVVDKANQYYENLRSSEADNISVPAAEPVFVDLTPETGEEYDISEGTTFSGRALFTKESAENKILGRIDYNFEHTNKAGLVMPLIKPVYDYKKIDTSTTNYNEYDAYYKKEIVGEKETYVSYTEEWDEDTEDVYQLFATLSPSEPGSYRIKATNYAGRGNTVSTYSGSWIIPFAKEAKIFIAQAHLKLGEESGTVTIEPTYESPDKGVMTYQWYKDNQIIASATDKTYEANSEGEYNVKVINTKNGDSTEKFSDKVRVSYPPAKVEITGYKKNGTTLNIENLGYIYSARTLGVSISFNPTKARSDEVSYQWFKIASRDDNGDITGTVPVSTSEVLELSEVGEYYVEITNSYNTFVSEVTKSSILDVKTLEKE